MLAKGRVSVLFSKDGLTIELEDDNGIEFLVVNINQEHTLSALSRHALVPCELIVRGNRV